ncbi:hypothetical protein KP509_37G054000 [Ceratopteris richardii]|uniref:Histone H2A/H2B/H3 domain-containing protein n=1 Tax=Ceratopteris richardii TaxID=49495 RepID=A0A8T2Q866_CERRI|nr:hypothetical protein KP509_37G054000 [Ceratopteris richardii]
MASPCGRRNTTSIEKAYSKKRVRYHVKSLREMRRAQKFVGLLIPRLPFMRVALLCLQEAPKDFAIDFMNDAFLLATHCHRVTLMDKDYVVVSKLRYKFEKVLAPLDKHD